MPVSSGRENRSRVTVVTPLASIGVSLRAPSRAVTVATTPWLK